MKTHNIKTGIASIALATMLSACGDDTPPTTETIPPPVDTIALKTDGEAYAVWQDFYKKNDISFSLDSFKKSDTLKGELYTTTFIPSDSFNKKFGKLLVYNNDSSMFLDAYSTTWLVDIDKQGKLHAREGEADQEVTFINTKTNERKRLFFCGPGCQVQKVFWYNDEVVGIMGLMAEDSDEYYTPTIWFVNVNNGITIPYQYNSSVSIIHAHDYMKQHLESKGITMDY